MIIDSKVIIINCCFAYIITNSYFKIDYYCTFHTISWFLYSRMYNVDTLSPFPLWLVLHVFPQLNEHFFVLSMLFCLCIAHRFRVCRYCSDRLQWSRCHGTYGMILFHYPILLSLKPVSSQASDLQDSIINWIQLQSSIS